MIHEKLKSYCSSKTCENERMFVYVSETKNHREIYQCEVCGNIRIPPINIGDLESKIKEVKNETKSTRTL